MRDQILKAVLYVIDNAESITLSDDPFRSSAQYCCKGVTVHKNLEYIFIHHKESGKTHSIKQGTDTLAIAHKMGVKWDELKKAQQYAEYEPIFKALGMIEDDHCL